VTDPNTAWDFDYRAATGMLPADFPFTALIMAAILRGDSANRRKIMCAFPAVAADLTARGVQLPLHSRLEPTAAQALLDDIELAMDGPSPALLPRVMLELRLKYPEAWQALTAKD